MAHPSISTALATTRDSSAASSGSCTRNVSQPSLLSRTCTSSRLTSSRTEYADGILNADGPLQGHSIFHNVFMYIAGLSVDCGSLMEYALEAVNNATAALAQIMPQDYQFLTPAFWQHLHPALSLMFDQGERPAIIPLRLAMCKLFDATFLYLMMNPAFQQHYMQTWTPYVFNLCCADNVYFAGQGQLGPASQPAPQNQRPRRAREGLEGAAAQSVGRRVGAPAPGPSNAGSSAGQVTTTAREPKGKEKETGRDADTEDC